MSIPIANFASCLGKYDSTIVGSVTSDTSNNVGFGDVSFNGGYVLNTTQFVLPPPLNGNGISFSGWFYPVGTEPVNTALFDMSCSAPVGTGNIAVYFSASNAMSMIYNGNSATTGTNTYIPNTWNFFMYTVCCSGTTVAVQNLYVNAIGTSANPATLTSATGTYTQFSVINTYLGFGNGSYNANKFAGKMDDFRFYSRVISPMEYRVLYGFNYGKNGANTLTLSFGTNPYGATAVLNTLGSGVSFNFSTSGTFAYFQVTRTLNKVVTTNIVSASSLVLTNGIYTWTDNGLTGLINYSYLFTPYSTVIRGITNGNSTGLTNIVTTTAVLTALLFNYPFQNDLYDYHTGSAVNNGTLSSGNIYWQSTGGYKSGVGCLYCSAINTKFSFPTTSLVFKQSAGFSVAFWFKGVSGSADAIFCVGNGWNRYYIKNDDVDNTMFLVSEPWYGTIGSNTIYPNIWYHCCWVVQPNTAPSIFYINGGSVNGGQTITMPTITAQNITCNAAGVFYDNMGGTITKGWMNNLNIFDSAITQEKVTSLFLA